MGGYGLSIKLTDIIVTFMYDYLQKKPLATTLTLIINSCAKAHLNLEQFWKEETVDVCDLIRI